MARRVIDGNRGWSSEDALYLNVGPERSEFGWAAQPARIRQVKAGDGKPLQVDKAAKPEADRPQESPPRVPAVTVEGVTQAGAEHHSITVTGDWYYFTDTDDFRTSPTTRVPARYFLVELARPDGTPVAYGYTDVNGHYSIAGVNPAGGLKARILAYVKYGSNPPYDEIRVVYAGNSLTGLEDVWPTTYTDGRVFDDDGGTHSLGEWEIEQGGEGDGAFWIKDDLDRAYRYLYGQPGEVTPGSATAKWTETSDDGDHYDYNGTDQVHLKGITERRPDAVVHEYGHNAMDNVYGFLPPTDYGPDGMHYLFWNETAGTAWVEGWATSLALVVNGNGLWTYEGGESENLEDPTWGFEPPGGPPGQEYVTSEGDTVEGRVAGALWDIHDDHHDGYDQLTAAFEEIWETFSTQTDETFAQFWAVLKTKFGDQVPPARAIFQNTIPYPEVRLELTASSTAGGDVTIPGEGTFLQYEYEETVPIEATPDTGYHFVQWTGSGVDAGKVDYPLNASTTIYMDRDYSVQANFAINTYTLNISAGSGGTVSVPGIGQFGPYPHGQHVDIVASPDTGRHFVNWSGNTGTIDDPNSASTYIIMNGNYSIQANFAVNTYTLNISAGSGGTVSVPGIGQFGPYPHGQHVDIVASPDTGRHFVNWSGNTGTIDDPNSASTFIVMTGNYSIQANFAINTYMLNISSGGHGTVTVPGMGQSGPYNHGHVVNLSASADGGYHFLNWTGDTGAIGDPNSGSTYITMLGDYSIQANFVLLGDANQDGNVNAQDITKTERIVVGFDAPTPESDAVWDGVRNARDVTMVERIIAGLGLGGGEQMLTDTAPVAVDAPAGVFPGSDFTASVTMGEVAALDSTSYDVTFNPAVLRLDGVSAGSVGGQTVPVDMYNPVEAGRVRVVQNVSGLGGVSGSGTLAVLQFHVLGADGQTSDIGLSNAVLSSNLAEEIPASWTGDSVEVYSPTVRAVLQGGAPPYPAGFQVPLTLRLYDPGLTLDVNNIMTAEWLYEYSSDGGDIEIFDINQTTKTIRFNVLWDHPEGTYHVTLWDTHISPWDHTLINLRNSVAFSPSLEEIDMETLQEGNPKEDVQINIDDFTMLLNDYLPYPGQPNWNDGRCDFDHTLQVTSLDHSLLSMNYNEYSPVVVGGGQLRGEETFGTVDMSIEIADAASLSVGKTLMAIIQVKAGAQSVDGVDAFLTFDPAYMEVVSLKPGGALGNVLASSFDNAAGTITLSLGREFEAASASGTFTLGTIELRAKAASKGTALAFEQKAPRQTEAAYHGEPLLGSATGLTVEVKP